MEEICSAQRLENEILEDARKKAARILQNAELSVEKRNKEWKQKLQLALAALEKHYTERLEKRSYEIMARLPLDKRRIRAERAEALLRESMQDYLGSLDYGQQLFLMETELRKKTCCTDSPLRYVTYSGLDKKEAEKLVRILVQDTGAVLFQQMSAVEKSLPAMVMVCDTLRIRVSLDEVAERLLSDYRAELAAALLGEGAIND